MLQRSKSEIFILYKCRGMRRAIQSRYLNRFVKCLCVGFSKWSVYLCFLRTDMYVSDFDYGFLFLPPFYLRIAMFWQWYYFFFSKNDYKPNRWKIGLYCSTNKHYLFVLFTMVWTYHYGIGNISLLPGYSVYIHLFFFFFSKDQQSIIASYIRYKMLYSK